jgi:hypothetical protein
MNIRTKWRAWIGLEGIKGVARKPWVKKVGLTVAGVFVVITAALFFGGPPLLKSYLTDTLATQINRKISVGEIRVNPFVLSVTLRNLKVLDVDAKTPYLAFGELYANAQLASIVFGGPVLREIRLVDPYVHLVRYQDESYNFEHAPGPLLQPAAPAKKEKSKPLSFSLNNIRITGGKIAFDDLPKNRKHEIRDLKVAIPFLSNLFYRVDDYVQPELSAVVNGAPLHLTGQSKPFEADRESSLELKLSRLALGSYLTYVPKRLHFTLPSGTLDANIKIAFLQPQATAPLLRITGNATLLDMALDEAKDVPTLRVKQLYVGLGSIEPLVKRFTVDQVAISEAELFVRRDKQGRINLANLVEPDQSKEPLPFFLVREAVLNKATVHVRDEFRARPFETVLTDVHVAIYNLTSAKGQAGQVELSAAGPGSAVLKSGADVVLEPLVVSKLNVQLSDLKVTALGGKNEIIRIGQFGIAGGTLDLGGHSVNVDDVTLAKSQLNLVRSKRGVLNLSELIDGGQMAEAPSAGGPEWQYAVNKLALDDVGVHWRDEVPAGGAVDIGIEKAQATLEGISSAPKASAKLALKAQVARSGNVAVDGSVVLAPLSAKLQLNARDLPIVPVQPYFSDKVHITVTSGSVSASGSIDAQFAQETSIKYSGDVQVNKFASVDQVGKDDFLKWETLRFDAVKVATAPLNIAVGEIALRKFYSRLIINPDGFLNVQYVMGKEPGSKEAVAGAGGPGVRPSKAEAAAAPPKAAAAGGAKPVPVKIRRVTLQGGQVNFSDHFIKPNYSANLTNIGGTVSGLSSDPASAADVVLRGKVDNEAPLQIKGKVNPLSGNLFLDIAASAKGVNLPAATPYSSRYTGYPIIKGKLSMDVKYHIENRKLSAENRVMLDQLTFGERVEGPDATKLPVLLAVALLKDRNGVIDVNLPISGSLDAPDFSIGGIIVRVIVNLVVKAVTAPFALLGHLFGGGEELAYIDFAPGQTALDASAMNKVKSLTKALQERPGLKLDITGRVDSVQDKEALIQMALQRKVKAVKFEALTKQGAGPASLDEVKVDAAEYPKLLKQAYGREKFDKPRNMFGFAKDLPVPEMEKLMLAHIVVGDDDLRQLATQRARTVAAAITADGKVSADRIFILEPKLKPEPNDKLKASRVDFSLK